MTAVSKDLGGAADMLTTRLVRSEFFEEGDASEARTPAHALEYQRAGNLPTPAPIIAAAAAALSAREWPTPYSRELPARSSRELPARSSREFPFPSSRELPAPSNREFPFPSNRELSGPTAREMSAPTSAMEEVTREDLAASDMEATEAAEDESMAVGDGELLERALAAAATAAAVARAPV